MKSESMPLSSGVITKILIKLENMGEAASSTAMT